MNELQRQAVLLGLIARLKASGSWCGETHIQKTAYFLQEAFAVPLALNFILYKHGPYAFDLNDELTALRANRLLTVQPVEPYGAHLYPSDAAPSFLSRFPTTLGRYERVIDHVARHLGPRTVTELERCATALYVIRNYLASPAEEQAAVVHQLKPHVTVSDATAALAAVQELISTLPEPSVP